MGEHWSEEPEARVQFPLPSWERRLNGKLTGSRWLATTRFEVLIIPQTASQGGFLLRRYRKLRVRIASFPCDNMKIKLQRRKTPNGKGKEGYHMVYQITVPIRVVRELKLKKGDVLSGIISGNEFRVYKPSNQNILKRIRNKLGL